MAKMCRSDRAIGLNDVVLRPSQVGAGYRLQQVPGGHQVRGQVTMDLCGYRFRSESLRTGRVQVAYVGASSLPELSNEVVSYSPGGAAHALREVNAAVAACPHHAVASTVRGVPPLTYEITRLQDAKLPPGSIALSAHITGTANGKRIDFTESLVYQIHRDVLSAVYVRGGTASTRVLYAFHAAEESAGNLGRV